jgi:hypothetical protein
MAVMDQLILFLKPNKNERSEKKMNHSIPQTKHTHKTSVRTKLNDIHAEAQQGAKGCVTS